IARRVQQVADRLGLGLLLDRRPAELSGGQRQRVALGRALVREPQVFLLDEPLSNLEPTLRGELRADLLELHRALHTTVVYVTHDQIEAMTMGQRIAVLEGGRLRQVGTPAEVYGRPADVFVARFIGNPGMNILRGRRRGRGGGPVKGVLDLCLACWGGGGAPDRGFSCFHRADDSAAQLEDQLLTPYRARHPGLQVLQHNAALAPAEYRRLLLTAAASE